MGQKLAAYNTSGEITGFYDTVDSPVPIGVTAIDITDAQWQECLSNPGYTVVSGVLTPPSTPSSAQLLAEAQAAQIALLQSSYKSAINAPVSFKNSAGVTSTYPAGNTVSLNGNTATQNLSNAITAGATAWTLGKWLDTNNVAQTFAYADLVSLAGAMEAVETLDWQDLIAKIAEVNAATTVSAVQAITF